jgi:uncharacterized protein
MKTWTRGRQWQMGAVVVMCAVGNIASAVPISLATSSGTYHQDFNTLATNGISSTLPAGWAILETGPGADGFYGVSTGTSTAGNTYSYGSSGASDRALGTLLTSSSTSGVSPVIGVAFHNLTGYVIDHLAIEFVGEQWRRGNASRSDPDRLAAAWGFNKSGLGDGTWNDLNDLDFLSPVTSGSAGALDGNLAANQTMVSHSFLALGWQPGDTLWVRWTDMDALGADDGLAIDDFSFSWRATLPPNGSNNSVPDAGSSLALFGLALSGLGFLSRRAVR